MIPKTLGWLALIALIFSALWLALLITGMVGAGPMNSFDDLLVQLREGGVIYVLTYINAALITLSATALMAGLYEFTKRDTPWAVIGLIFTPVYCALNLFVYLSQITIVPALLRAWHTTPGGDRTAYLLLSQMVQQWAPSGISFFNNLAYAILGIPSMIFGLALVKRGSWFKTGGLLLVFNGAACLVGVVGILFSLPVVSLGSLVGGVLFITALVPLSIGFFNNSRTHPQSKKVLELDEKGVD